MRSALKDFTDSTASVRDVAKQLEAEHLAAVMPPRAPTAVSSTVTVTVSQPAPPAIAAGSSAPGITFTVTPSTISLTALQARHSVICTALTVILSGFLEAFIHDCAKAAVNQLATKGKAFTALPQKAQDCHIEEGSRVLADRAKGKAHNFQAIPEDLCTRLAAGINTVPAKLLWEAFARTDGNPNSDVIKSFLRNFGVKEPVMKIEAKSGKSWLTIHTEMEAFIQTRNQSAHTGTAATAPQPATISDNCDQLDTLSKAIVEVLEDHFLTI